MKENRNVIVTGGNSHLGKAVIQKAKELYNGKIITTTRKACVFEEYENDESFLHLSGLDLTGQSDIDTLAQKADSFFDGQFDIIHCVGTFWHHIPTKEINMEKAKQVINDNFITFYGVCHNLIPLMQKRGGGRILTFSCNSVKYHFPFMVAFTASKAAVEHSVKSFAYEFGCDGIRINAIALSSLQTDTVKQSKPYADFENFMPVEKVAHHALILSSNDLEFLNGETISLFKYSKSFFEQGYLTRNRQE